MGFLLGFWTHRRVAGDLRRNYALVTSLQCEIWYEWSKQCEYLIDVKNNTEMSLWVEMIFNVVVLKAYTHMVMEIQRLENHSKCITLQEMHGDNGQNSEIMAMCVEQFGH